MATMYFYKAWMSGQWVGKCPSCGVVCPSWDDDDLNDDGDLVCQCDGGAN